MSIDEVFARSGLLVMPFWFLMAFLPHWRWTKRIIGSPLVSVPAAVLYAWLVLPQVESIWSTVSNADVHSIAALLGSPEGATIAWAHFLAFDLFVGRWAYLDSRLHGVNALLMVPILFLILMLGPIGFVLYLGVRALYALRGRQWLPQATLKT